MSASPELMLAEIQMLEALISGIEESKSIITHPHLRHAPSSRNRPRTQLHTYKVLADYDKWKSSKRYHAGAAKQAFDIVQQEFRVALLDAVKGYRSGKYKAPELRVLAKVAFDKAYRDAYLLGLRASGVTQLDMARHTAVSSPAMDPHDAEWLKSSLAHERRYWNDFVKSLFNRSIDAQWRRFTPEQRVDFYVSTLSHAYEVARVVGHPQHSIFYWVLHPAEHCDACIWLSERSPFTRETLPTVPRAGGTPCLANCRCALQVVTHAKMDQWWKVKLRNNRDELVRKLAAFRRR